MLWPSPWNKSYILRLLDLVDCKALEQRGELSSVLPQWQWVETLTRPALWSRRGWKTTFRCCQQLWLLSVNHLAPAETHWRQGPTNWPRLHACRPWIRSDPNGKKHQALWLNCRHSGAVRIPTDPVVAHGILYFLPMKLGEWNIRCFPCNEERCILGTSFLTRLSPSLQLEDSEPCPLPPEDLVFFLLSLGHL